MRHLHYNMEGEPISLEEGEKLFEDGDARIVAKIEIGDITVSTVLLVMDHRFGGEGPPLIFETMIFGGDHDGYEERYSTREEAEAGHARAVKLIRGEEEE
jgi:hypothetical protein